MAKMTDTRSRDVLIAENAALRNTNADLRELLQDAYTLADDCGYIDARFGVLADKNEQRALLENWYEKAAELARRFDESAVELSDKELDMLGESDE